MSDQLHLAQFPELSPEAWASLEKQAEAFEATWAAGRTRPRIEDFLLDPDPTQGQLLVELVVADIEHRARAHEVVIVDEYFNLFPELTTGSLADELRRLAKETNRPTTETAMVEVMLSPTILGQDSTCDAFRLEWESGDPPSIETYLAQAPQEERSTLLLELVRTEANYRRQRGETPTRQEYVDRFPEYESLLISLDWPATDNAELAWLQSRIRQFDLLERIGSGGFGSVWKAKDRRLGRLVAIKVSHQQCTGTNRGRLFAREGRAAAQLRHPNIVAIHDINEANEPPYIVYEFIEGVTLQTQLSEKKLELREAAELCCQLADAVQYAHTMGVIHRDLKPSNILLDREGKLYVTDFGLAKNASEDATIALDGLVMGSMPYMSPEQAAGDAETADARTDVYSLAIILYELITGTRPFAGHDEYVLHQIRWEEPKAPRRIKASIPRDLETICLKAIAKQPDQRYASAAALGDDLRRFLDGRPILARRVPLWRQGVMRVRRQPMLSAAPVAVFAAAFAFLGLRDSESKSSGVPVAIDTSPSGAEIRFVPLDPLSGELRPTEMMDPGRSPVEGYRLIPGEYLVVAALDDGRFHEVYRHVPGPQETTPYAARHLLWTRGSGGNTRLPDIKIPDKSVTESMAFVEGSRGFEIDDGPGPILRHQRTIPSFYIDTTEFTVGDYKRMYPGLLKVLKSIGPRPDDFPHAMTFIGATDVAEAMGKRIPTEAEYEYVATAGGTARFPWGDLTEGADALGPVKEPAFDKMIFNRPVFGLASNAAEWTSTWFAFYPASEPGGVRTMTMKPSANFRVVRGASEAVLKGDLSNLNERDPQLRTGVSRFSLLPGLGFRGVRSAKARLNPTDFERIDSINE